jgi:hypothetical protein
MPKDRTVRNLMQGMVSCLMRWTIRAWRSGGQHLNLAPGRDPVEEERS